MMVGAGSDAAWEARWASYDEATYARALAFVPPGAVVLDIGAGDLRFARQLAASVRLIYAVERRPELLAAAAAWLRQADNVRAVCADARDWPFPPGLDVAVLLMRHCAHFALYRRKLEAVGCRWLITNARWRMAVECIDLAAPALALRVRIAGLVRLSLRRDRLSGRAGRNTDRGDAGRSP